MKKQLTFLLFTILLISAFAASAAQNVPQSLKGLKTARIIVDLNQGNGDTLKLRLDLLAETIRDIEENNVKADVVVAVRGQASRFMTKDNSYIQPDEYAVKQDILNDVASLKKSGVKFEQCAIALRLLNIERSDVSELLTVVKNGYVSLIGYQNRGYAMLPME